MKKKFDPVYTVDITDCTNVRDIIARFAEAKVKAGLTISEMEYGASIWSALSKHSRPIFIKAYYEMPRNLRPNIFKRFWNWITRKK